jgi:uroporphyrinogen decarboxylase
MYWLHCCGNIMDVVDYMIDEVKIDAFHSFHDEIIPVGEFKKTTGIR